MEGQRVLPALGVVGQECPTHTLGPVALFILFARSARAWVVAADFIGAANDLLDGLLLAAPGHAGLFQFAALLALESFLQIVD